MYDCQDTKSEGHSPIEYQDFVNIDIRVGIVIAVEEFPQARKPSYKLKIDFGETLGIKKSAAAITAYYSPQTLLGRKIIAVVNLPVRQIGRFLSEVLILGVADVHGNVVLLTVDKDVSPGGKIF